MTDGMWDPAIDAAIEAHRKVMKAEEELDKLNREKQEANLASQRRTTCGVRQSHYKVGL